MYKRIQAFAARWLLEKGCINDYLPKLKHLCKHHDYDSISLFVTVVLCNIRLKSFNSWTALNKAADCIDS